MGDILTIHITSTKLIDRKNLKLDLKRQLKGFSDQIFPK